MGLFFGVGGSIVLKLRNFWGCLGIIGFFLGEEEGFDGLGLFKIV
jgi:hypothetical protein